MKWLDLKEKAFLTGKSILVVLLLDYFFYQSFLALSWLCFIGIFFYRIEKRELVKVKKSMAKEQFKELLLLVCTGQKAGLSVENAFLTGYRDMKNLYGEKSFICEILYILKAGKENHIPFAKLWRGIGDSTDIQEIREFAAVYEIAYRSSGNMTAVMEKTAGIIIQKIETEKEIEVMLSARKMEQKIMNGMPFFIMLYINLTSPGYFDGLYHSYSGMLIMTICLLIYLGSYILSRKLSSIEV